MKNGKSPLNIYGFNRNAKAADRGQYYPTNYDNLLWGCVDCLKGLKPAEPKAACRKTCEILKFAPKMAVINTVGARHDSPSLQSP